MTFTRTIARGKSIGIRVLLFACASLVLGAALHFRFVNSAPDVVCGAACNTGAYTATSTPAGYVALTFDDGPVGPATDSILATLETYDAPATFFLLGENVAAHPEQVRDIYAAGHTIGNHTFTHAEDVHGSRERIVDELNRTNTLVEALIGKSAVLYRPPYLLDMEPFQVMPPASDKPVWRWVYDAGYVPVGVDLDSDDWVAESTPEALAEARAALDAKASNYYGVPQHVFLFHDEQHTAEALPAILAMIREYGYEVVPLERLLGITRAQAMPIASVDPGVFFTRFILMGIGSVWEWLTVLMVFVTAVALFRVFYFAYARLKQRTRADIEARLLPRFVGTISVLIPAYNESENVRSTIRSVLANTRQPDEILVIDDGSTDDTFVYAEEVAREYPNIVRVLRKENGGKASALNLGLAEASGDVVVAIDGDTVLHPGCIDALVRPFASAFVGASAGKILPANARTLMEKYQYIEYLVGQNVDKEVISSMGAVNIVPGAVGAWRREAVRAAGGYSDDTLVEDQDLTLSLLGMNYGVVYVPDAIAYTEVPTTMRSFYLQRFRWMYGTFQCMRKYRHYLMGDRALRLGWISLPYAFMFNIVMPVVALVLLCAMLFGVLLDVSNPGWLFLVIFTALDAAYAYIAFLDERDDVRGFVWLVPVQRFAYLFAYSIIVTLVLVKLIDRSPTRWNKLSRTGAAERYFREVLASAISRQAPNVG